MKFTNKHADACLKQLEMYEKWYAGAFNLKGECQLCESVSTNDIPPNCRECVLGPRYVQCLDHQTFLSIETKYRKYRIKARALYLLKKFNKAFKGRWVFAIKLGKVIYE